MAGRPLMRYSMKRQVLHFEFECTDGAKANDVIDVLKLYLHNNRVDIITNAHVAEIKFSKKRIDGVKLNDGRELIAKHYAICTGGKSYPSTGSTGDAYQWLSAMGHDIIPPEPALTTITVKEKWIKELEGLSLKNIAVNIYQNNKKILSRFGEALFTDNGLSGPIIIDMSKEIGLLLKQGRVDIQIDFRPTLSEEELDKYIQKVFIEAPNKLFRNSLGLFLPQKLIPRIVKLINIDPEQKINSISREERCGLLQALKHFTLQVDGLGGFARAVVTAGGVNIKEVDPQTMHSKKVENLYIAGELLDLDGPTGGYNLQICWSTGYVVGQNFINK